MQDDPPGDIYTCERKFECAGYKKYGSWGAWDDDRWMRKVAGVLICPDCQRADDFARPLFEGSEDYLMLKSQVALLEIGHKQLKQQLTDAQTYIAWLYKQFNGGRK